MAKQKRSQSVAPKGESRVGGIRWGQEPFAPELVAKVQELLG